MHPPPVRRQLMMYLFWLARPCTSVFGSNATTSNEISTGGRDGGGGGGGGPPAITKHTEWCQLAAIPRLFVREKRMEDPESGFPLMSVIAVQCHNNLQDTHWLMCSTNGTWLIYNDLRVTTSSKKECHFNGNAPKFKNMQPGVAFTTSTQNVSSASHRRMTSVILCVSFMIFFTAFSLGMKFVMGKYEVQNFLGSSQRSNNNNSETNNNYNNERSLLNGHHQSLTAVGAHPRWTPIDHHHHHHMEQGMDISTVNGHLMMYRPSSVVPVHVVVTTFVNGISNPSPSTRTSSGPVTSDGVYLSDTVPSYEEALAQEEPPPSYHDIYNEGLSKREVHREPIRAPAPPPLYPVADANLLRLPYGLRPAFSDSVYNI